MSGEVEKYSNYYNLPYASDIDEAEDFSDYCQAEKLNIIKKRKTALLKEKELVKDIIEIARTPANSRDKVRLKEVLDESDLELVTNEYKSLSKAEKKVIRMDYWGVVSRLDDSLLSDFYKKLCNSTDSKAAGAPRIDNRWYNFNNPDALKQLKNQKIYLASYDLSKSPSWQLFRQFKNFRKIGGKVKHQLRKIGLHPNDVVRMSVEDYSDVMFRAFPKNKEGYNANIFLGAKCSFIKDFIKKFEKPFVKILKETGVDERYISELIKNMKSNGVCEGFKVFDEKGEEIKGIKLSVHHKVAVNDANSKSHLAQVNLFENLCLCIDAPYHSKILHAAGLERIYKNQDGKEFRDSIKFKNKDVVFMGGLSSLQQICYDYSNDERTKKAIESERYNGPFISNEADRKPKKEGNHLEYKEKTSRTIEKEDKLLQKTKLSFTTLKDTMKALKR